MLERELTALGADAFPETPDLVGVVRARLEGDLEPRRSRRRTTLALVLVVVAVAIGAAFAVPQARSAILRWFGIGGVRVQFVDRLPAVPANLAPIIGVPVSLDEASARVGFHVLVPAGELGPPDAVYVGHFNVDEVTLLYGSPRAIRLLLTEVDGRLSIPFAQKFIQGTKNVKELTIGGRPALWIEGAPHEFVFVAPNGQPMSAPLRLDKNTLLWQRKDVLLRLEGDLTLAQALRVAASL
jgi:hypothetical protein